jgi:hypothetical protein
MPSVPKRDESLPLEARLLARYRKLALEVEQARILGRVLAQSDEQQPERSDPGRGPG